MTILFDLLLNLKTKPMNLKYVKKYCKFIHFYLNRSDIPCTIHKHHIIPKCMMNELNIKESIKNLVFLSPREHKFVHNVLKHAFPKHKIARAYNLRYKGENEVAVLDLNINKMIRVNVEEYYLNLDRYIHPSKGYIVFYSPDGIKTKIKTSEVEYYKSSGYKHKNFGVRKPDGFADKLREINTGKHLTQETKDKLREINTGKKMSAESIEKMRNVNLGINRSKETIEKLRKSLTGRKLSKTHLENLSITRKLLIWINDGKINKRVKESDLEKYPDFVKGRIKKNILTYFPSEICNDSENQLDRMIRCSVTTVG